MRTIIFVLVLAVCVVFVLTASAARDKSNKYVGVKVCSPCHKTEKQGKQFDIWQKSSHAKAYHTLMTKEADEIAKKKGLKKAAAESPECLECHTITADPKMVEKSFDVKDGVQCEKCHGCGSAYKSAAVMKDHAKAVAVGMTEYKDDAAIEKLCKTCHNEKSPTFKAFEFKKMWDKIKHPVPAKS